MKQTLLSMLAFGMMTVGCGRPGESDAAAPGNSSKVRSDWLTDFDAAKAQAAERGLPILVNFSGSDWCGWCIKLEREVFEHQPFADYAKENLVLFVADFPRRKSIPEGVKAQNEQLAQTYGVQGFPTILLLDATGKELVRTGYERGGSDAYVKHLKKLVARSQR